MTRCVRERYRYRGTVCDESDDIVERNDLEQGVNKVALCVVWRIVMTVDAGAVAEASAPSTSEKLISSPRMKNDTMKTITDARHASSTVITTTFPPFFLRVEKRKNSPVLNAMNARAISFRKSIPSTMSCGTRFNTYGPSKTPESMYAVTLGSRSRFVMRVIAKPVISIRATEIMIPATGEVMLKVL